MGETFCEQPLVIREEASASTFIGKLKGNCFVIYDGERKREVMRWRKAEDFVRWSGTSWNSMDECVRFHFYSGDIKKWLLSIGERKFCDFIMRFADEPTGIYVAAARLFMKNKKAGKPSFSDVVGCWQLKLFMRERVVYPAKYTTITRKYGRNGGGCAILYGPPGCGKTYVASAVSGETDRFFSKISVRELMEFSLSHYFHVARKVGNMVVLIDEMELLAVNRDMEGVSSRMLVNELLTQLDKLQESNGLFIMGSTNSPWLLDPAMLRSGRIDNLLYVGVPDEETRLALLKYYSRALPIKSGLDFRSIAQKTEFFSCSDMAALCQEAAACPMREALAGEKERQIAQGDFELALQSVNSTAVSWFEGAMDMMPFPESFAARFSPMIKEIERYRKWKKGDSGNTQFR